MAGAARKRLMTLRARAYRALMKSAHALGIRDGRKVVFDSFGGHAYSDNPRAVCEALLALRPDVRAVWLFKDPRKARPHMPERVRAVRSHSLAAVWHMATAGTWVFNGLMPHYAVKGKGQFYVQTWHGDRPFKVCLQESGKNGLPDAGAIDLAVAASRAGTDFFRSAFQYQGDILVEGSPRNDVLVNPVPVLAERTRKQLGLRRSWGVAMFAPTMREHLSHTAHKQDLSGIDLVRVLDLLEKKEGRPWRMLVRAHSTVAGLTGLAQDSRILDVSGYEDMRDLLAICDLLLSDYSSCASDFPLTGKPVALFQPDLDQYQAQDRPLYFSMEDTPYWAAANQRELEQILLDMDPDKARDNDEAILDFFGTQESGHAARAVAQRILQRFPPPPPAQPAEPGGL